MNVLSSTHLCAATLLLMGFSATQCFAQTQTDKLPNGRQVSGWAVELLPAQRGKSLREYQGMLGEQRISVSGPISLASDKNQREAVINARAFLKVTSASRYLFAAEFDNIKAYDECNSILLVGNRAVFESSFFVSSNDRAGQKRLSGSISLDPGHYRAELVAQCKRGFRSGEGIKVNVLVRDDASSALRTFDSDELIHFQR